MIDKSQILNFYDKIVTQASGYNFFVRPSDELTPSDGVIPDSMIPDCEIATATALHSKFSQTDTISTRYTDAHYARHYNKWLCVLITPCKSGASPSGSQKYSYN